MAPTHECAGITDKGDGTFVVNLMAVRRRYHDEVNDIFRWLSAAAATSVLENLRDRATALRGATQLAKRACNQHGDVDLANEMLGRECVAAALACEAMMWLALRAEDPHTAWRQLVDAEQWVLLSLRTPIGNDIEEPLGKRYCDLQRYLFPRMVFLSAAFNHDVGFCTICDERLSACPHIKGRIYAGQVCAEYGFQRFEANHVAIVDHPMDKHCYAHKTRRDDGVWVDRLSGAEVNGDERGEHEPGTLFLEATVFSNRLPLGSEL